MACKRNSQKNGGFNDVSLKAIFLRGGMAGYAFC